MREPRVNGGLRHFMRKWWPLLALLALGLLSIQVLRSSHSEAERLLQQTTTGLENVQESRRRLITAYLNHSRQVAGDPTFDQASAQAELRAAGHALNSWYEGRSGIIDLRAAPPTDTSLIRLGSAYAAALEQLHEVLSQSPGDAVQLRRTFSHAEHAVGDLETALHNSLRDAIAAGRSTHRVRLTGWSVLLLLSLLGAGITHRALSQSEINRAQSDLRLARLRELAPVGIVECDAAGSIIAVNFMWMKLTGRSESEWIGRTWWDGLDEKDRGAARNAWQRSGSEDGADVTVEARFASSSDKGTVWSLVRIGSNPSQQSPPRRVVTFTDITQQRNAEEQLHHAQRMEAVGRLAAGVAHDFNNLLTSIRGFASLSLESARSNEALYADLLEIERAADRGRALTRQLLTFSRQDRVDPQVIDLRSVVSDIRRMLDRLVPAGVDIHTDPGTHPAPVLADRGQLEQVITNLVVNAADAMNGDGRIQITVGSLVVEEAMKVARSEIEPGSYTLLSVSDTGPGIPPDVQDRMFEPFFTTKERGKGTGLGLSTVWGIVRQGGGHIHLYSGMGQGTTFRIYLPAMESAEFPAPVAAPLARSTVVPGTALVVDDDDAVRRITCRVLELNGWSVLDVGCGTEALEIVDTRSDDIDILVTDLAMRGMNGVELVARLHERGVYLPVLFVSGYAESDLDLAGAHFLEKPFTPAALIRRVGEVLAAAG